jgi:hypothetical protein
MILNGKRPSQCCSLPTILVRSRDGGWITQNCSDPKCGKPYKIFTPEMPDLRCNQCGSQLTALIRHNYFYRCDRCDLEWELAPLLPDWHELFEYHGFGLASDREQFGVYRGPNPLVITLPGQKRQTGDAA